MFDFYDYVSLYLSDWQRDWVHATYLVDSNKRAQFEKLCINNDRVKITPAAVYVAQYLFNVEKIVVFPWAIVSRSVNFGVGDWKMILLDESLTITAKTPISTIVEHVKKGEAIKLIPHLDKSYYELTI
jgi:hypothetical protein